MDIRYALLTLSIALSACSGTATTAPTPQPVIIKATPLSNLVAFMGDSITNQWNLAAVDPNGHTLNAGVPGDTTVQMLARFRTDVLNNAPGVVVILGGVNDFRNFGVASTDNIAAMARMATAAGAKVILCSVLPTNIADPNLNLPEIAVFNDQLLALAQKQGYLYADYYDVFLNPDGSVNDALFVEKLHPNDAGHSLMWTVVAPLIAEDLK